MSIGTIFTALVLLGIVAAVILQVVRDRRRGKCTDCFHSGSCACTCEKVKVSDTAA